MVLGRLCEVWSGWGLGVFYAHTRAPPITKIRLFTITSDKDLLRPPPVRLKRKQWSADMERENPEKDIDQITQEEIAYEMFMEEIR